MLDRIRVVQLKLLLHVFARQKTSGPEFDTDDVGWSISHNI